MVIANLAGETDPKRLADIAAEWLVQRDMLYVLSIMCAPGDPAASAHLGKALTAGELHAAVSLLSEVKGLEEQLEDVRPIMMSDGRACSNLETINAIANRVDPQEIIRQLLGKDWLGHAATGFILRWIVSRTRAVTADGSLTRAAAAIEKWCAEQGVVGGKSQNVVRHLWPEYRCVSHLWAALQIAQSAEIDMGSVRGFQYFLSTAQWLLETACTIIPKGRKAGETVLLRAESWEVPRAYVLRGKDGACAAVWSDDLDAHDIRLTGRPM